MKKLKGVAVGLGYFSQFHLEAWGRLHKVDLTAICDTDEKKALKMATKFGVPSLYTDVKEMLQSEQPDFIDIITPPETHLELCQIAAERNVSIICQKPLAPSFEEAKEIAALVNTYDVRIMVHENFRFQPWHREIKKLLNKNTIGGQLQAIQWRMRMGDGWQEDAYMNRQPYFRKMKKLLLYETGIHLIDVLRFFGGEINQVYAQLKRYNQNIEGEDSALVICNFEKGGTAIIDASRYHESTYENPRLTFGEIRIEGDRGSIYLNEDGKITIKKLGQPETVHDYTFKDKSFSGDCVYATQKHFVGQLQSEQSFETDVEDYLSNIAVMEKAYESNRLGIPL
ncbi:MAG: Gfo/Idh/MocA family oxidoreductase [Bacteroidota bacterium]